MIYITHTAANILDYEHDEYLKRIGEIYLIENLCQFEGYKSKIIYPEDPRYKQYYKGGRPAILVYEEVDKEPTVFYGFWEFAKNWNGPLLNHEQHINHGGK